MNFYVFILILLLVGVGAYWFITNDHTQIASAMNLGSTAAPSSSTSPAPGGSSIEANPYDGSTTGQNMPPTNLATNHASAETDSTNSAAAAPTNLGTVKTLTGITYTNCKVLKVEADGVTLNCDEGIIKVLYPLLPADLQRKFGYDPQKAIQTTAQPAQ